jgi:cobalt-zinc-cadmium efflux system outer membrane protein
MKARTHHRWILVVCLAAGAAGWANAQLGMPGDPHSPRQQQDDPGAQAGNPPMNMDSMRPLPPPVLPKLGVGLENPAALPVGLQELENRALKNNPTIAQAEAEIRAAGGRQMQAGLWPNPTVGYIGEQIRGGSYGGGEQGFFVEQNVLLGGKLGLSRKIYGQEIRQAEQEKEEQIRRVQTNVRVSYYRALAAQDQLNLRRELAHIAGQSAAYTRQLFNIGQKNEAEVLASEIEADQSEVDVIAAEDNRWRAMATLAAVVGDASVQNASVAGSLESNLPELDDPQMLAQLLRDSPAVRIAEAGVSRAEAVLAHDRREAVPDLVLRGGLQDNLELLDNGKPVGLQGFAEVGLQLKLFNRNQGNVEASEASLGRAEKEVERIKLVLTERAAYYSENYRTARAMTQRYRERMIPNAEKAYQLMYREYGLMHASFPQVLTTQRQLFQIESEYVAALERLWANSVILDNFLLTDGLESPSRPVEMDHPVREVNAPESAILGLER